MEDDFVKEPIEDDVQEEEQPEVEPVVVEKPRHRSKHKKKSRRENKPQKHTRKKKFEVVLKVGQWGINCEIESSTGHILLSSVVPKSIAHKAGLKKGDRVLRVGGDKVPSGIDMKTLFGIVGKHKKTNKPVVIRCVRIVSV